MHVFTAHFLNRVNNFARMNKKKIFISWSCDLSKDVGAALNEWLPNVLQAIDPFFSPSSISKGKNWNKELFEILAGSNIGVFCLTQESLNSHWMVFEAGAISKNANQGICTVLINLQPEEIQGPYSNFQHSIVSSKEDMYLLVRRINEELHEHKMREEKLRVAFDKWWPDFETTLKHIYSSHTGNITSTKPDKLDEILTMLRSIHLGTGASSSDRDGRMGKTEKDRLKSLIDDFIQSNETSAIGSIDGAL